MRECVVDQFCLFQITQGFRTLELCVDNLTPDFLDPILGEVQLELMQAIWRHIRPLPYPHGPQAARILGKLAGRNRRFLQHPQAIKSVRNLSFPLKEPHKPSCMRQQQQQDYHPMQDESFSLALEFQPNMPFTLPLGNTIIAARKALLSPTADFHTKVPCGADLHLSRAIRMTYSLTDAQTRLTTVITTLRLPR
jgi:hypothetical protein